MARFYVLLLTTLLLSGIPLFAQSSPKDERREWQREAQERDARALEEKQKDLERQLAGTRFASKPSKELLPPEIGSWVLHIVTTGGYSGRGLPTLTITSRGEFACGESESLRFLPLNASSFLPLAQVVSDADFKAHKTSPKRERAFEYVCKDCYNQGIYLTRREADGRIRFYRNVSDRMKFLNYAKNFDLIKQRSMDLADCTK